MSLSQATALTAALLTFTAAFLGVASLVRPESKVSRIWKGNAASRSAFALRLGVVYAGLFLVGVAFMLQAVRGDGSLWLMAFIPGMLLVSVGWLGFMLLSRGKPPTGHDGA